jgi:hypothetical protein
MPKRADAAPLVNKITELQHDMSGLRNFLEDRLAEIERVVKIDVGLRAGVLKPDEAARLLARPDARVVVEAVRDVLRNRIKRGA